MQKCDAIGMTFSRGCGNILPMLLSKQLSPRQLQCRQLQTGQQTERSITMLDVMVTVTVFHTLAAVALFSLMVVGVVNLVRNPK